MRLLKTTTITPTLPQPRRDASLPELRSRLKEILNVPMGKEAVLAGSGLGG
ncbi:MAG: hypothetical protein M3Z35_06440 [Nitrospirota bacterium]|nr:hypothetical protein [Nitrospirota bacterium]